MIRRDMVDVLAIEESTPAPWDEERILKHMDQRNGIGFVAEHGAGVVGYMLYEIHPRWLHLARLAVHPGCRRRRVATELLVKLAAKLGLQRQTLTAAVPEGCLDVQLLLRSCGFRCTGEKNGAYQFRFLLNGEG